MFFSKVWSAYHRAMCPVIATSLRHSGVSLGRNPAFYGMPLVRMWNQSVITIGDRVVLCSDSRYTALALNHRVKISTICKDARIEIHDDVGISGACIVASEEIIIGSQVLLGANTLVVDTDFHPVSPENRRFNDDPNSIGRAPVYIGENVFVGVGATILKGVRIEKDCVVAAGAVVIAGDYPSGAILAGNPARIVGSVYRK